CAYELVKPVLVVLVNSFTVLTQNNLQVLIGLLIWMKRWMAAVTTSARNRVAGYRVPARIDAENSFLHFVQRTFGIGQVGHFDNGRPCAASHWFISARLPTGRVSAAVCFRICCRASRSPARYFLTQPSSLLSRASSCSCHRRSARGIGLAFRI